MKNIENKKLPQMLLFNTFGGHKNIWHHFGLFLSLFSAFHLKVLQLCKKPQSYISGTHQLLFPLVKNGQNWCQKLWTFFSPLLILQGECAHHMCLADGWTSVNNDGFIEILWLKMIKRMRLWTTREGKGRQWWQRSVSHSTTPSV